MCVFVQVCVKARGWLSVCAQVRERSEIKLGLRWETERGGGGGSGSEELNTPEDFADSVA